MLVSSSLSDCQLNSSFRLAFLWVGACASKLIEDTQQLKNAKSKFAFYVHSYWAQSHFDDSLIQFWNQIYQTKMRLKGFGAEQCHGMLLIVGLICIVYLKLLDCFEDFIRLNECINPFPWELLHIFMWSFFSRFSVILAFV